MKTYTEIKKENKDYHVILTYAKDCQVHFTYCYNSIANTYSGLQINTFTNSIRGLLRVCPDFFNDLSEHEYRKCFERLGFEYVTPTQTELTIWG